MKSRAFAILTVLFAATAAAQDYAAWKNVNRDGSWTHKAEQAVAATPLTTDVPRDIDLFCPNYGQLDAAHRTRFWVALLSAMAGPESNYRPETSYLEPAIKDGAGKNV